jgi:FkbM family methyltransferase
LVDGEKINFVVTSFLEYSLRAKQSYEREKVTMRWIKEFICQDDVVFDVGANVGAYSLVIGKMLKEKVGKVYAFEPEAGNYYSLNRNIRVNNLEGRVLAYSMAFGKEELATTLFLSSTVTGSALHGIGDSVSEGRRFQAGFVQGVVVQTMQKFCRSRGSIVPNHVKIDVDGNEFDVLLGMGKLLTHPELRSLMVEVNEDLYPTQISNLMEESGFKELMREKWDRKNTYNIVYVR